MLNLPSKSWVRFWQEQALHLVGAGFPVVCRLRIEVSFASGNFSLQQVVYTLEQPDKSSPSTPCAPIFLQLEKKEKGGVKKKAKNF